MTNAGKALINKKFLGDDAEGESDNRTPEEKQADEEQIEGLLNLPVLGEMDLIDTGRSVQLYMPAGLQYRDTVNYENADLGGMGATVESIEVR